MSDKIVLNDVTSGFNTSTINSNFQKIEDALNDQVLYRESISGTNNAMDTDLDMNGKRIYNLPAPKSSNEPVRLIDLENVVGGPVLPSTDASNVNILDVGNYYTGTNVEDALQELGPFKTLKTDLADFSTGIKGAGLVGYNPALSYPVNTIGKAIGDLANQSVIENGLNLFDYIPSAEHAAIRNWTSTYDATADIQAWLNAISNSTSAIGIVPNGKINHKTVYGYYDAVKNPGFNVKRDCKLRLIGSGTTVEHYILGEANSQVGTLWNCTDTAAGAGWIFSPSTLDASPFLSRDLILEHMSFTGSQNDYLVQIRGVPNAHLFDVELIPANNSTGALAITTSYFGVLDEVRIRTTAAVTAPTKQAVYTSVSNDAPGAGLFCLRNCNISGLQNGLFHATGGWTLVYIDNSQISCSTSGYNIYSNGTIDKLTIVASQFESGCRGWIKSEINNGIKCLEMLGCWGLDQGNIVDAQAIYLPQPDQVFISGFFQNMRKALLFIDGYPSTTRGNYKVRAQFKFYEASGTMRTMFTGIIPDLECDTGGATNAQLYNPSAARKPIESWSKGPGDGGAHLSSGSFAMHNVIGQSPATAGSTYYHSVLGYAASVPLYTSSGTVNLEFDLGSTAGLPDGYLVLVHNKGAGTVNLQRGGVTFATLAADTNRWTQWSADFGAWL